VVRPACGRPLPIIYGTTRVRGTLRSARRSRAVRAAGFALGLGLLTAAGLLVAGIFGALALGTVIAEATS
jgi:hypothetical protein